MLRKIRLVYGQGENGENGSEMGFSAAENHRSLTGAATEEEKVGPSGDRGLNGRAEGWDVGEKGGGAMFGAFGCSLVLWNCQ